MNRVITRRRVVALLPAAVGVVALSGCAATRDNKRADDLRITVLLYLQSLRWGNYTTAIALLRRPDGTVPETDVARLEGLRVTTFDFEIVGGAPGQLEASMTATLDYYWEDQGKVRKIGQQSRMWWDATLEQWFIDDVLPAFKR